jgi:hypothetical protein
MTGRIIVALTEALLSLWQPVALATPTPAARQAVQVKAKTYSLIVTVTDENGLAVPSTTVILLPPEPNPSPQGSTDSAGRFEFTHLAAGPYRLRVEKEGFYAMTSGDVLVGQTYSLDVTLAHQQEYKETVHVNYSPPAIDPAQTATTQNLTGQEVIQVPYSHTRDVRNALPLIPGVLPDINGNGQVHVEGSASNQVLYTLDGFDISHPVSGLLDLRVSTDAVRSVEVLSSRTSVASGPGSAGLLNLETSMGDDHFRFFATDFVPSLQDRRGIHIDNATPRFTFSGPIRKGKAWFYEAVEGEYDLNILTELPPGEDRDHYWRFSNLSRAQVNLASNNRLTGSLLINHSNEDHAGLSIIQPLSTTTGQNNSAGLAALKDQATWANGTLFEVGFAYLQFDSSQLPLGTQPYVLLPGSAEGNYYLTANSTARRFEGLANLFLPPLELHGQHQISLGTNLERVNYRQHSVRSPFTIVSASGLLERSVSFAGNPSFHQNNFAGSGFVQDRWSPSRRLLVEAGARLDVDDIIRRWLFSPRLAATYVLSRHRETKLSAGIGIYYDRTDLDMLSRPLAGQRQDVFYAADGITPLGPPVVTQFQANPQSLLEPRFTNWSAGLEHKLPAATYLKIEFVEKRGRDGFDYEDENLVIGSNGVPSSGLFVLRNDRRDRYDGVTLSLRHAFKETYPLCVSYTRSNARSDAILDSTLDSPFFSPQLGGPLAWDSPNRVLSWGAVPFKLPWIKRLDLAYSFDWRSGYPYNLINQEQELVGLPDRTRFPDYAALNVHIEKRFRMFGFEWALRGGFNNVTNRRDPSVVDNNVDSPTFGAFSNFQPRVFTGRIRFLGRK